MCLHPLRRPAQARREALIGATNTRCFNKAIPRPDIHPYCPAQGPAPKGYVETKGGRLSTKMTFSPNQTRRIWNADCRGSRAEMKKSFAEVLCGARSGIPKPFRLLLKLNRICTGVGVVNWMEGRSLYNKVGQATQHGQCLEQVIGLHSFVWFGWSNSRACQRLRVKDAKGEPAPPPPATGWRGPAPKGIATYLCGAKQVVPGALHPVRRIVNGNAVMQACLVYFRNNSGTYYHQGVLKVKYNASFPGASDLFAGQSMSVRTSTGAATGVANCARVPWLAGNERWCFSPTKQFRGRGEKLYAKANLIDHTGRSHPIWSPALLTR